MSCTTSWPDQVARGHALRRRRSDRPPRDMLSPMKFLRRSVATALVVLTFPAALAETKAWQDTITLPTWLEGPPETFPRIEAIDPSQALFPYIIYPYSVRLNFTQK